MADQLYTVYFCNGTTEIMTWDAILVILELYPESICDIQPYEETPPPVYTCPYCGETFSSQAELDAHIAAEHSATPGIIADIIGVSAPSNAIAGETVIVDVSVMNNDNIDHYIAVTGSYDSSSLTWQFGYLLVSPSQTVVMRGSFTMPNTNVDVTVWSWHLDLNGTTWILDDQSTITIENDGWVRMIASPVYLVVTVGEVVIDNWQKMTANPVYLTVAVGEVVIDNWQKMLPSPVYLVVTVGEVVIDNWQKMTANPVYLVIKKETTTPPPEGGEGINWPAVILIGGGAAVAIAAATPKKTREKIAAKAKSTAKRIFPEKKT